MYTITRKCLAFVLVLGMLLSMAACGKQQAEAPAAESTVETTVPEETYVVELTPEQEQARKNAQGLSFTSVDDGDILTAIRSDGKVIAFPAKPEDFYEWKFNRQVENGYYGDVEWTEEEKAQQLKWFKENLEETAMIADVFQWENIVATTSNPDVVFGLTEQGTVLVAGSAENYYREVPEWTDIVSIAGYSENLIALRSDGTVVVEGKNPYGLRNATQSWTGVKEIYYSEEYVEGNAYSTCMGVKEDGTLLLAGALANNVDMPLLEGVKSYALGAFCILGLREDGTVAVAPFKGVNENGLEMFGLNEAKTWTDITAVAAGATFCIGLKADGTVVVSGLLDEEFKAKIAGLTDVKTIAVNGSQLQEKVFGFKNDGSIFTVDVFDLSETNEKINEWADVYQISAGKKHAVGLKTDGTAVACGDNTYSQCDVDGWTDLVTVAAGPDHSLGLKVDGTAVAVGNNEYGACNVEDWKGIKMISATAGSVGICFDGSVRNAGGWIEVEDFSEKKVVSLVAGYRGSYGICEDGSVVACGSGYYGDARGRNDIVAIIPNLAVCLLKDGTLLTPSHADYNADISAWTDIVDIFSDGSSIMALKSDGTVLAAWNSYRENEGQFDVEQWTDIVDVAMGYRYSLGLKSDGTVVAVGSNEYGQCDVAEWTDIVALDVDYDTAFGVKADGSVVVAGDMAKREYEKEKLDIITSWTDIVEIKNSNLGIFGLRKDGTVCLLVNEWAEEDVSAVETWTDIVQLAVGDDHVLGLKSDGSVVATGNNDYFQCQVNGF